MLLLALPFTIAVEMLAPGHAEVVMHLALAAGTLLVGLVGLRLGDTEMVESGLAAARRVPWPRSSCCRRSAQLTDNEALRNVAYSTEIGGWGETVSVSLLMVWLIGVARTLGRGVTMVSGVLAALAVIGMSVWAILAAPLGATPAELRLLFLLPVAWLFFVSTRPRLEA